MGQSLTGKGWLRPRCNEYRYSRFHPFPEEWNAIERIAIESIARTICVHNILQIAIWLRYLQLNL